MLVTEDHKRESAMAATRSPQSAGRKLTECIAIEKAYEEELGYALVPDAGFTADVQAALDAEFN